MWFPLFAAWAFLVFMPMEGGVEGEIAARRKILFWLQPKEETGPADSTFSPALGPRVHCSPFPCCFSSHKMQVITLGFWVQRASQLLPSGQQRGKAFLLGCGTHRQAGTPPSNKQWCVLKREKKPTCLLLASSDLIVFHQNILLGSWALSWERFPHPLSFLQGEYCLYRWQLFALWLLIYGAI